MHSLGRGLVPKRHCRQGYHDAYLVTELKFPERKSAVLAIRNFIKRSPNSGLRFFRFRLLELKGIPYNFGVNRKPNSNTNFQRKTETILGMASHGKIGIRNFETVFPNITRQIRADSNSTCFDLWGHSFNFDEHELSVIVDPKLLTTIGRIARYSIRLGPLYHAGLIHTYGYLLSNLPTRFGYKRERWTNGLIEESLGLSTGLLLSDNAQEQETTLLQNVSYLMGRIAFSKKSQLEQIKVLPNVSNELTNLCFEKLSVIRIEELTKSRNKNKQLKLITDIVRFPSTAPLESLLVYSFEEGRNQFLVTCFAMDAQNQRQLIEDSKKNETPIRPRYNLAHSGLDKTGRPGKRAILKRRPLAI